MMSLFSSFDLMYSWKSMLLLLFFVSIYLNSIFIIGTFKTLNGEIYKVFMSFFVSLNAKVQNKFTSVLLMTIFTFVMLANVLSVMPYNFPVASQLSFVLMWSLSGWLGYTIFYIFYSFKSFSAHCIPEGCPIILSWFIFVVELISQIIRPITLTVRLAANILAGHLLMILLSQLVLKISVLVPLYSLLNMVEFFVGLIQSYIFCTMLALYHSEIS